MGAFSSSFQIFCPLNFVLFFKKSLKWNSKKISDQLTVDWIFPHIPPYLGFSHLLDELTELRQTLIFTGLLYNRGWDGWLASPTRWTWVWASSGSWWWTGKPGILQSIGLQRGGLYWATELHWILKIYVFFAYFFGFHFCFGKVLFGFFEFFHLFI